MKSDAVTASFPCCRANVWSSKMPRREFKRRALSGCRRWELQTPFPKKLCVLPVLMLLPAVSPIGPSRQLSWCTAESEEKSKAEAEEWQLRLNPKTKDVNFLDILHLAVRNLRQAKLRAVLTTMGVIVGVAVIVTMVSFGLGLQRNMLARFSALDLFNEMSVYGKSASTLASTLDRGRQDSDGGDRRGPRGRADKPPTRILNDAAIEEISKIPGVAYVEPSIGFPVFVRTNGKVLTQFVGGGTIPNASSRFKEFHGGQDRK